MLLLLFAVLAAPPQSAPVYLACHLDQATGPLPVEVALDEANQKATIALPTGWTTTRPALFSPTEVRVPDKEQTWFIDRVSLAFGRSFSFSPHPETGKCALKAVPRKRAF